MAQIAPRTGEFEYLKSAQIQIQADAPNDREAWALRLSHPQWGHARLASLKDTISIPKVLIEYDNRLDKSEKAAALLGRSSVQLQLDGEKKDVLRDRKRLLRFLDAVMGDDGLIAMDVSANHFWPKAALADELCHDADLDIDSLFTVHAVTTGQSKAVNWYHTHGLAEMGFFDFDVLRPSPDLLTSRCHDFARAIAFAIVEGKAQPTTPIVHLLSSGPIRFVDVAEFNRRAAKSDRALRDADDFHNRNRTVLCEPDKGGWRNKIFGAHHLPIECCPRRRENSWCFSPVLPLG